MEISTIRKGREERVNFFLFWFWFLTTQREAITRQGGGSGGGGGVAAAACDFVQSRNTNYAKFSLWEKRKDMGLEAVV